MIEKLGRALLIACLSMFVLDAHAQTKISGLLQPQGNVRQDGVQTTPNGLFTVFIADANTDNTDELYVVPAGGGARVKISPAVAIGPVTAFHLTPDSNRAIFTVQTSGIPLKIELWGATLDGSQVYNLSGPVVPGADGIYAPFHISDDGSYAVFYAHKDSTSRFELYSVPVAGGATTKLSGVMPAGSSVQSDFLITPNSQRVVFRAPKDTPGTLEIYSVPIAGGGTTKLNGTMVGGVQFGFTLSPDSARAVYLADAETAGVYELWSAQLTVAGSPTRISGAMITNGDATPLFYVTPDSSRVVFRADRNTDETYELWSAPIAGGVVTPLSSPTVSGGNVPSNNQYKYWQVSPDGTRAVYIADREVDQTFDLWSVPVTGGTITKLSGLPAGRIVQDFAISADSKKVVFRSNRDTDTKYELYTVPIDGGAVVKVSGSVMAGQVPSNNSGTFYAITPDSARVLFLADKNVVGTQELFFSYLATGGEPTRISGSLAAGGNVSEFAINPLGGSVAFRADKDTDQKFELYATNSGGLVMDIDGNGIVDALTDGLMLIRWQFGLKGPNLIAFAIGPNATRNTAALIEAYLTKLDTLLGPN